MQLPDYTPTIPAMLHRLAQRFGERELVVLNERRLRYVELEAASARLARGLLRAGVGKGTRVGLLMPNGPDWMIAWFAAARVGALAVPINTFYQARELGWLLQHADIHTLLCVSRYLNHDYLERLEQSVPELGPQTQPDLCLSTLPYLRAVYVWGESDRKWARSGTVLDAQADADPNFDAGFLRAVEGQVTAADPAMLIYSSGSVADPKGALHTHGALVRHSYQLATMRDLTQDDRVWSPMPFFWIGGLVFSLLGTMHHGACLITEDFFEPGKTLDLLERERVTVAAGWPHYGKALSDHPSFKQRDLSRIRSGNIYALQDGPVDPELRGNSLGMTETCGPHTYVEGELPEEQRGSYGPVVPGLEHKVIDPDSGAILPPGTPGEICVRGYSLMQGLYKVEREETFDADGYYHTGDVGYFKDGILYFQGRQGDMIKTGGANVAPVEIEKLLESYPEVKEAFVVGVSDPVRGQNVAAAIVTQPGASIDPDSVRTRVKAELSAYKVPRHVLFYEHDALPFTDSGKIDKRRLEELLAARIAEEA
ncbi:MAG: long-chain fatty acid--CoA ligase [Deltaproteobacteria bacterium]|nr:MAG: long-chain fatty acid--CoA ligase [Deltaproteobacteria bacterium]